MTTIISSRFIENFDNGENKICLFPFSFDLLYHQEKLSSLIILFRSFFFLLTMTVREGGGPISK